tara:strand:- start:457 stop:930 length:474 start_codon:yes stop_codon:yes gene_type:complete
MTEASFSFKQTEIPFIGSAYPIYESKLTKFQRAILALKPETDQCIEMGEFLSDSEITSLVYPIKRKLIRTHGMWTDEFHLNRQTKWAMEHGKDPTGNKWNPAYAKYTVVWRSFEKRYEMGVGASYKRRFYVRYSRFYADALARGEVIKPKAKEKTND